MRDEKLNFYILRIEKQYPKKLILNQGQMLNCIGISRATFSRIIQKNELFKLPNFKKNIHLRKGNNYATYQFTTYDIALFLSNQGEN